MKFLSIYKSVERNTPPTQEEMASMGRLIEEGMKAGWLVSTEGCLPSALGARVRRSSGKVTCDRRSIYRVQRNRGRVRDPEGEFQRRGDQAG